MARYVARFMKDVLGENGHEAEICQRSMEIEASGDHSKRRKPAWRSRRLVCLSSR